MENYEEFEKAFNEHFENFELNLLQKTWKGFVFKQHPYYSINLDWHGNEIIDKNLFIQFIDNLTDRFGLDWYNRGKMTDYDINLINSTCRWERCWYNINVEGFHMVSLRVSFDFSRRYKWNIHLRNVKSTGDAPKGSIFRIFRPI